MKNSFIFCRVVSQKKTKYLVDPSRVETGDVLTVKFVTEDKEEKVVLFKNEQKVSHIVTKFYGF